MRRIDADSLKENIDKFIGYLDEDMIYRIKVVIDNAPTIKDHSLEIAQKSVELGRKVGQLEGKIARQQGEWIDYDNTFYKCPECGYLLEKCCPQCQNKVILPKGGAKMVGGES